MGRNRQFQIDEALDAATRLFWSRGYSGTSLIDLEQAVGVGRTSLYCAFGSKADLFIAVVDFYRAHYSCKLWQALSLGRTLRESLDNYFGALLAAFHDPTLPTGCLITNVAVDGDRAATRIGRKIADSIAESEDSFYRMIRGYQIAGDVAAHVDARALARFLVSATHGVSVLARTSPLTSVLRDVVDMVKISVEHLVTKPPVGAEAPLAN